MLTIGASSEGGSHLGTAPSAPRSVPEGQQGGRHGALRLSIEALGAFALIEAALWDHMHIRGWTVAAAAWIVITTIAGDRSPRQLGCAAKGFRESLWIPFAGVAMAALILLSGRVAGTLHFESDIPNFALHSLLYMAWAFGQQFILQSFLLVRFEQIFRSGPTAVLVTALLFVVAHLPNPVLLIVAGIAGIISIMLFRRYRNIYTLAIAHALVGLALAVSLPESLTHQMKVGFGYYHYLKQRR